MYNTHFQEKCGRTRKKKKRFTKEKVLARLGRLRLQGALAPANFFCAPRTKEKALLLSR